MSTSVNVPAEELVTIVTGGASGIGKATVEGFVKRGHPRVVVADRNRALGEAVCKSLNATQGGQVIFVDLDVAKEESVQQLINQVLDHFGRIDYVVHCAGIGGPAGLLHDIPSSAWQRVIDVDLSGTFYLNKALIKHWRSQEPRMLRDDTDYGLDPVLQRGSLVNIASINGTYASAYMGDYVAAKHGVHGVSKTIALENVDLGIRVNTVSPGCVFTPIMQVEGFDMNAVQGYLGQQAMKRFAHPEEIAAACYFLCSDEASFVTGTNMYLDAGWSAH